MRGMEEILRGAACSAVPLLKAKPPKAFERAAGLQGVFTVPAKTRRRPKVQETNAKKELKKGPIKPNPSLD